MVVNKDFYVLQNKFIDTKTVWNMIKMLQFK